MSRGYEPRRYAAGSARRDFRKYFIEQYDPETGEIKRVRPSADYWKRPESDVPLKDLPVYWEYHNTQFTDDWCESFNQRLIHDYAQVGYDCDPEISVFSTAGYENWVKQTEQFFDDVRKIETWPFWKYTEQKCFRPSRSLVSDEFHAACPAYGEYLDFRSKRYTRDTPVSNYVDWRRDCLYKAKHGYDAFTIQTGPGYQYRDETLQLGEIEMQHHAEPFADSRISIYEYFAGQNLVPTPGMPDLDIIRRELREQTGVDVNSDVFVRAMSEHAERQAADRSVANVSKSAREREMDDLERLVADLTRGQDGKERRDDSLGW